MKKLYSSIAILLAFTAFVTATRPRVVWLEQILDYVNRMDGRMWDNRYLINFEFYQPGGPLFVYVGGEGPLSPSNIGNGTQIYRMAREHHGILFHTEHRFYGESRPFTTTTTENLKYLNAWQAVNDLVRFLLHMNNIYGMRDSKVILVGCSYAGALATWLKKTYPDLANGVWASSATLVAKTDINESKMLVGDTIRKVGGDACYNRIKGGIVELETMFENKRGAEVKTMFKLCPSFNETNSLDVSTLFFEISEMFSKLATQKADEIQQECNKLVKGSVSDLLGLAYYIADKLNGDDCNELSYNSNLNYFKNTTLKGHHLRQWLYQSCNEFGWFKPSSSPSQIFGYKLPLDYFVTLCADIFGDKFTKEYIERNVEETNARFGGLNPDVENVYWTNGEMDPYRLLGIQSGPHATVIPDLTHCGDMHEITPEDSPELKASKAKLEGLVREWLA